jgi:hypothetical protein
LQVASEGVRFICGDMLKYDWSDGDVVFANSTWCGAFPASRPPPCLVSGWTNLCSVSG